MEVLTILVVVVAWLSAIVVSFVFQRHYLARGYGWFRSTATSGCVGTLAAIGIVGAYFATGTLFVRALR